MLILFVKKTFADNNKYKDKHKQKDCNTQHVQYFQKAGALRISVMILRGGVAIKSAAPSVRQQHQIIIEVRLPDA